MRWPAAFAAVVLLASCGSPPKRAAPVRHSAASCSALVSELRRARNPDAVARAAAAFRGRAAAADIAPAATAIAAAVRVRRGAFRAIGDRRATTARRLFARARVLSLRAEPLLAELDEACRRAQ